MVGYELCSQQLWLQLGKLHTSLGFGKKHLAQSFRRGASRGHSSSWVFGSKPGSKLPPLSLVSAIQRNPDMRGKACLWGA